MSIIKVSDGTAYPLGATYDGKGTNFALFSANAEKVELCLYNENGTKETARYTISINDNNDSMVVLCGLLFGL